MNERSAGEPRTRPGGSPKARWAVVVALTVVVGAGCTRAGTSATTTTGGGRTTTTVQSVAVLGQPAPPGTGTLEAVSCADIHHCWAVGRSYANALAATTTSGASTTTATSVVVDATVDGGATWSAEQAAVTDPTDLAAIDCPDPRHCVAVGSADQDGPIVGAVLVTTDGGRDWQAVAAPSGAVNLSAVECVGDGDCMVLANDGSTYWSASTTDGGQVWQRGGSLPAGFGGISSLSCIGPEDCVTAGYQPISPGQGAGAVAVTTDGGATWAPATTPAGLGILHSVSCTADSSCVAVGTKSTTTTDVALAPSQILVSGDGGQTWTLSASPPGVGDAFAVSCPTDEACAAVGTVWTVTDPPTPIGGVVTTGDGGVDWATALTRYVPVGLIDVDCPAPATCVAAGNDVLARITLPRPQGSGAKGSGRSGQDGRHPPTATGPSSGGRGG